MDWHLRGECTSSEEEEDSQKIGLRRVRRTWKMENSREGAHAAAATWRVKLQNPFVLRVGQVMTGVGVGCGLGIGVGVPIPMGNSLTFQFRRLICHLCQHSHILLKFLSACGFWKGRIFWVVAYPLGLLWFFPPPFSFLFGSDRPCPGPRPRV
jgi:hypothetical protein